MTHTPPPPNDDDLPDEQELASLYARLPKVEPDASLDAAVLAEATRAIPMGRRPRWPVALASAAVLVLAVGVAWQMRDLPAPAPAVDRLAASSGQIAQTPVVMPPPAPPAPPAPPVPPSPAPAVAQAPMMSAAPAGVPRQNVAAKVATSAASAYSDGLPNSLAPDDRVGEIRRLLGRGERSQALRELKELRRRYPHYDLPQDLRDLTP